MDRELGRYVRATTAEAIDFPGCIKAGIHAVKTERTGGIGERVRVGEGTTTFADLAKPVSSGFLLNAADVVLVRDQMFERDAETTGGATVVIAAIPVRHEDADRLIVRMELAFTDERSAVVVRPVGVAFVRQGKTRVYRRDPAP